MYIFLILKVEELRQEKMEIDQQLRTIHGGPDRGEYREEYRGGAGREYRGSYDNESYHRQSHDYRDSYHPAGSGNRREYNDGSYQRNYGPANMGSFRDHQGKIAVSQQGLPELKFKKGRAILSYSTE